MPRIKGKFNPQWIEIFRWMEANPNKPYAVECGTAGRCNTLRVEFYRARSALMENPLDDLTLINTLKREVNIDGTAVVFRTKTQKPIGELLSNSLQHTKDRQDGIHGTDKGNKGDQS